MTTFVQAVRTALDSAHTFAEEAPAVLAMPEMQAIRKALLTFAANVEEDWGLFSVDATLRVVDGCCLPNHVVDWLME